MTKKIKLKLSQNW